MYSRSYYSEEEKIKIPENYDGTALRETEIEVDSKITIPMNAQKGEPKISPREKCDEPVLEGEECSVRATEEKSSCENEESFFRGFFKKMPFKGLIEKGQYKKELKLGIEEILILSVALFLFFSKDGDKECALLVALLFFIN